MQVLKILIIFISKCLLNDASKCNEIIVLFNIKLVGPSHHVLVCLPFPQVIIKCEVFYVFLKKGLAKKKATRTNLH